MVWPPGNPMASSLNDEFNANNLDTAKWYHRDGVQYPIAFNDNGRIRLNGLRDVSGDFSWQFGHLESQVYNYNVDGVSVRFEPPTDLWNNPSPWNGSWSGSFEAKGSSGSPATSWGFHVSLEQSNGESTPHGIITSYYTYENGPWSGRDDVYDFVNHRYLRLRSVVEAVPGTDSEDWIQFKITFLCEASPDEVSWTTLLNSSPQEVPYVQNGFGFFFFNSGGYLWLDHFKGWPDSVLKVRLANNTWRDIPLPKRRTSSNTWETPPNLKVRLANNTWKDL